MDNLQQQFFKLKSDLSIEVSSLKRDVALGAERLEEGESSFLKSFQDIKAIVLTKLQVLDK